MRGAGLAVIFFNIDKNIRRHLISLFTAYRAKEKLVYLKVPNQEILRRNRERKKMPPKKQRIF
jgi:predicted kinase